MIKFYSRKTGFIFKKPVDLLGGFVEVNLKNGGQFLYKITGCIPGYISGYDDEGLNIMINIDDIDFIIGR